MLSRHIGFQIFLYIFCLVDSWKPEATEVLAEESERPLVMRVIDVRSDHLPQVSLSSRNGSDLAEILINRSLALKHL